MFNQCHNHQLPLMKSSPPLQLFVNIVPIYFEKKVKDGLKRDTNLGVIVRVPHNTPVGW